MAIRKNGKKKKKRNQALSRKENHLSAPDPQFPDIFQTLHFNSFIERTLKKRERA